MRHRLARCRPDRLGLRKLQSRVGMVLVPPMRSSYQRQHWEGWDRNRLYSSEFKTLVVDTPNGGWPKAQSRQPVGAVNAMLQMDQLRYLPDDLLLKTDQATMAHGLEARAPLLDHRRYVESIVAGITIPAHADFRACVTMNEDESTYEVPDYILSRLQPTLTLGFPNRDDEMAILKYHLPFAEDSLLALTVEYRFLPIYQRAEEPVQK